MRYKSRYSLGFQALPATARGRCSRRVATDAEVKWNPSQLPCCLLLPATRM